MERQADVASADELGTAAASPNDCAADVEAPRESMESPNRDPEAPGSSGRNGRVFFLERVPRGGATTTQGRRSTSACDGPPESTAITTKSELIVAIQNEIERAAQDGGEELDIVVRVEQTDEAGTVRRSRAVVGTGDVESVLQLCIDDCDNKKRCRICLGCVAFHCPCKESNPACGTNVPRPPPMGTVHARLSDRSRLVRSFPCAETLLSYAIAQVMCRRCGIFSS